MPSDLLSLPFAIPLFSPRNRRFAQQHAATLGATLFASLIGPGVVAAGQVTVESDALMGAGAILLPGVCARQHAVVGAGSVVPHDVAPYSVMAGNPAHLVRTLADAKE